MNSGLPSAGGGRKYGLPKRPQDRWNYGDNLNMPPRMPPTRSDKSGFRRRPGRRWVIIIVLAIAAAIAVKVLTSL